MKPLPNLFGRASSVQADHERLRHSWAGLRELASAPAGVRSNAATRSMLEEFAADLRAHFSAEEAGYFDALLEEQPALATRIERLRADHRALLELLTEMLARARSEQAGDLAPRLQRVLDRLGEHEHAETALLQEFFGRVDGGEG